MLNFNGFYLFLIFFFCAENFNIIYLQNPISRYFNYLLLLIVLYIYTFNCALKRLYLSFSLFISIIILNCAQARTIRKKFLKNNSK